jgi:hypothetical protein
MNLPPPDSFLSSSTTITTDYLADVFDSNLFPESDDLETASPEPGFFAGDCSSFPAAGDPEAL